MRDYSAEFRHFEQEGYVVARGVMTRDDVAPVMAELSAFLDAQARRLQAEGKLQDLCEGQDFEHRVVNLYRQTPAIVRGMDIMLMRGPAMFEFLHNDHLLDLAEALLGPEITCNPIQHVRAKMPVSRDCALVS